MPNKDLQQRADVLETQLTAGVNAAPETKKPR
jgi:hypothetical protein